MRGRRTSGRVFTQIYNCQIKYVKRKRDTDPYILLKRKKPKTVGQNEKSLEINCVIRLY